MPRQQLAIALLVMITTVSCGKRERLPESSELTRINAQLEYHPSIKFDGRLQFDVPKKHWNALLKSFEPYKSVRAKKRIVYGSLELTLSDGSTKSMLLFHGEDPSAFSIEHAHFRGGDEKKQFEVLNAAYEDWQKSGKKTRKQ